jgi:hypothetical protein
VKFQNDITLSDAVTMRLRQPLNAVLVDKCGEARTWFDFTAEGLCLALSVNPNCGIRAETVFSPVAV